MKEQILKVVITIVIATFFALKTHAQNFVLNASFEDTVSCTAWTPVGNDLPCPLWITPTNGSPDYFSTVWAYGCTLIYAPSSPFGYQYAKTGVAYCGLGTYLQPPSANWREYIQSPLNAALINSHKYEVSFYVSLSDSSDYATDKIGAYLSSNPISSMSQLYLNVIPQVENTNGVITDTANWTLVSGFFIAQGGEHYITIGNFRNDANTTINNLPYGNLQAAYYYIDDVSVVDCTSTGINEHEQINFTLLQSPVLNSVGFASPFTIKSAIIFNTIGAMVKQASFNSTSNYIIDVADLPRGLYFLQVETKDKRRGVRKFIKE